MDIILGITIGGILLLAVVTFLFLVGYIIKSLLSEIVKIIKFMHGKLKRK